MNPDRLLAHFDRLADAPDAIPRLRRFILDLAVRGKLVEQDPNDEPASELLKRLTAEKNRQIGESKTRKQAALLTSDLTRIPFATPRHWTWTALRNIGLLSGGMTPSKNRSEYWNGEIDWFSPKDIKSDELTTSEMKITAVGVSDTGLQLYPPGCLFMVARSGILKRTFPVAISRVEAAANQDLKILSPFVEGLERYLQIMFRGMADFIVSELVKTGTTVQSLKYEEFEAQPFPLPPLAEQYRIVAKVDELMALCDQLGAARNERESRRDRLLAASLHRLSQPADDDEAFRADARFYFNHLPRLTTRPDHVKQLRQTILNLAVRGRLVPQDPSDEPATEVMKRICAHKERFALERKARRQPQISAISPDEKVFPSPPGWEWTRWGAISHWITYGFTRPMPHAKEGIPIVTAKNVNNGRIDFNDVHFTDSTSFGKLSAKDKPITGDILLTKDGAIGRAACVHQSDMFCVNQSVAVIWLSGMEIDRDFLVMFIHSDVAQAPINEAASGSAIKHISITNFAKMPLAVLRSPSSAALSPRWMS